jgi:hypothetical protein
MAALALLGAACEKKSSPPTAAPPSSGIPPLENAAAQAVGDRPTHDPTGSNPHGAMGANAHAGIPGMRGMPAGHPAIGGGDPAGEQATPGDIPFDPKTVIAGSLQLDKKVEAKVANGDVIYLVARAAEGGPPLAVKRLVVGAWPLAFSLDSRDAMMAGTAMKGKIVVSARVDKDGDAMTKNPGDVIGQTKPIEPPAKDVVLMLDSVL